MSAKSKLVNFKNGRVYLNPKLALGVSACLLVYGLQKIYTVESVRETIPDSYLSTVVVLLVLTGTSSVSTYRFFTGGNIRLRYHSDNFLHPDADLALQWMLVLSQPLFLLMV